MEKRKEPLDDTFKPTDDDTRPLPKNTPPPPLSLGEETTLVAPLLSTKPSTPQDKPSFSPSSLPSQVHVQINEAQAYHHRWSQGAAVREFGLRYTLGGYLGRGGVGLVQIARDQTLGRKVAFKSLLPKASREKEVIKRFWREAQVTAQLDHPNIVPIYEIEVSPDKMPGYTMKWVQGQTLKSYLSQTSEFFKAKTPLPETHQLKSRLEAFIKVCEAVAYAHDKGVIHRDLKPGNIMLGDFGQVYVMDWGLARLFEEKDALLDPGKVTLANDQSIDHTLPGQILGTPQYMSPEQAAGQHDDLDGRSDLYSLGLILFEIVSLRPAVRGGTLPDVIMEAMEGKTEPLLPSSPHEPLPPALRAIILKAIRPDPQDRYPTAEALASDLRRFLRREPVDAFPEGWIQTFGRWLGRHRFGVIISFLSLLLLAVSVAFWSLARQSRQAQIAFQREREISRFLTRVSQQANRVENHLLQYEVLLGEIASAAAFSLESGQPSSEPFFQSPDFLEPSKAPRDLVFVPAYQTRVSFSQPVWHLAPKAPLDEAKAKIARLLPLRHHLARVFLPEGTSPAAFARTNSIESEPLAWATLGLDNGLAMIFPGRGHIPPAYDPRKRPWYLQALQKKGLIWGPPYQDSLKTALYLPCSTSLRSSKGAFLGVAGIDLHWDFVRSRLLPLRHQPGVEELSLLDDKGHVLIRLAPPFPALASLAPPLIPSPSPRTPLSPGGPPAERLLPFPSSPTPTPPPGSPRNLPAFGRHDSLREPFPRKTKAPVKKRHRSASPHEIRPTDQRPLPPTSAKNLPDFQLRPYNEPLVLKAVLAKRSGWLEKPAQGKVASKLFAFYRLDAIGWYYVAIVDRDTLLRLPPR